jgi:hypothetical protein
MMTRPDFIALWDYAFPSDNARIALTGGSQPSRLARAIGILGLAMDIDCDRQDSSRLINGRRPAWRFAAR